MNDPATLSDDPALGHLSVDTPTDTAALEKRVKHLEETVTTLQDTKALEERVVDRVTERLQKAASSERFSATPPASPPRPTLYEEAVSRPSRARYAWLLIDLITDGRLLFVMLFDRRYAMAWTTHLVVWLFIPAILTSGWWFPLAWVPILGPYLDKVLDLLLAFCVYKALSRELRRYLEVVRIRR